VCLIGLQMMNVLDQRAPPKQIKRFVILLSLSKTAVWFWFICYAF
jgi:hypothetical protein